MNTDFERLTGTWYFTRDGEPENYGWFRILPNGRCVGFYPDTFNGRTRIGGDRL